MNTEAFIRDCAAKSYSRRMVADFLSIRVDELRLILQGMNPPVQWAGQGRTVNCRRALEEVNQRQADVPRSPARIAAARKGNMASVKNARRYTAFGITGTLPELVEKFGAVSVNNTRDRLRRGMDIEAALTTPRQDRENLKKGQEVWRTIITGQITADRERRQYGNQVRQLVNF